uniref:Uncharacterized protein n=1 Tax=Picea glauca TaxID=3330 RepID=A0A101LUI6_PICGL|nr:hypothetical protein ABT39_MTgene2431 [Picea glauca]
MVPSEGKLVLQLTPPLSLILMLPPLLRSLCPWCLRFSSCY